MNTFFDLVDLFRKGGSVRNPAVWKDTSNATALLVPLLLACVKVLGDCGYGFAITTEQATAIAAGIVACVQFFIGNISSKHAGLLPEKESSGSSPAVVSTSSTMEKKP